jgi:hypothetical protein
MELNKLYSIANKENIYIFNHKMKNKAIICEIDKNYYIGMNYDDIDNPREEKEILAEELGHYYCNALYNIYADKETIRKKEYRARKWAMNTLVPASTLLSLQEEGCKYSYEFAEELGVSEELVNQAYSYYKDNNYI